MSASIGDLFRQARELSEKDRAELASLLLESLEEAEEANVDAAWSEEISRRIRDLDSGRAKTEPWSVVRARLERQLRQA